MLKQATITNSLVPTDNLLYYLAMIAYLITNTLNGHKYVGITSKTLARRWSNHKAAAANGGQHALHRALRKYGVDVFTVERVFSCGTATELMQMEQELIRKYETRSPHGYNMTDGGDGAPGLTHTVVAREKIGAYWRGKHRSDETKRKIGKAHLGKTLSPEHRAKLSAAKQGKPMPPRSAEHRRKISEGLRRAHIRKPGSWA